MCTRFRNQEPDRHPGDWSVKWTDNDTEFIRLHLHELAEVDMETGQVGGTTPENRSNQSPRMRTAKGHRFQLLVLSAWSLAPSNLPAG
jgi:hypothetical protein